MRSRHFEVSLTGHAHLVPLLVVAEKVHRQPHLALDGPPLALHTPCNGDETKTKGGRGKGKFKTEFQRQNPSRCHFQWQAHLRRHLANKSSDNWNVSTRKPTKANVCNAFQSNARVDPSCAREHCCIAKGILVRTSVCLQRYGHSVSSVFLVLFATKSQRAARVIKCKYAWVIDP